jgi:hypothetical protein
MNTLLIAFGYKLRSGKDEAVKAIIAERGGKYDVRRYAFADELKREVNLAAESAGSMANLFRQLAFDGIEQQNGGSLLLPEWVQYDPNPDMSDPLCPFGKQRTLLQWWGTELRRERDPFYWVNKLEAKLEQDKPAIALIPDLRFTSEITWVTANKGFTVRVDRLGYTPSDNTAHESEQQLSWLGEEEWNYILQCQDGDLDELRKDAIFVFDHVVELLTPPDLRDIEKFNFVPGDLEETYSGN